MAGHPNVGYYDSDEEDIAPPLNIIGCGGSRSGREAGCGPGLDLMVIESRPYDGAYELGDLESDVQIQRRIKKQQMQDMHVHNVRRKRGQVMPLSPVCSFESLRKKCLDW